MIECAPAGFLAFMLGMLGVAMFWQFVGPM